MTRSRTASILGVRVGHRLDQLRVIVSKRQHPGTGEEVDEDIAVEVPDEAAGRLRDRDRQMSRIHPGVGLPPALPGEQFGRARSWQITIDGFWSPCPGRSGHCRADTRSNG
jgi:hypothetical protein